MDETPGRTEVFRVPDNTPAPDQAFYTITPEDAGQHEIRTTAGVIEVPDGISPARTGPFQLADAGTRLYGMASQAWPGTGWYWTTTPHETCAVCGSQLDHTGIRGRNDEFVHLDDDHEDHAPVRLRSEQ